MDGFLLRVASMSILSRDPDLSRKPQKKHGKQRSVFEGWWKRMDKESSPRFLVPQKSP